MNGKTKNKLLAFGIILCMLFSMEVVPAHATEGEIRLGDYVQMGTYYGQPILWRCVSFDENGVLMLSDKILCLKAFDSKGGNSSGSHARGYQNGSYRKKHGSNYWGDSNIRAWLNSTESAGNVVWRCGNIPTASNVYGAYNAYSDEAGFLSNFTPCEIERIKPVTQKSLIDKYEYSDINSYGSNYHYWNGNIEEIIQNYKSAYSEQITDKIFLLDIKQISDVYKNRDVLGEDYYIGTPTLEAVKHSDLKETDFDSTKKWETWLRSPYANLYDYGSHNCFSDNVRSVGRNGVVDYTYAFSGSVGVRPAFYLSLKNLNNTAGEGTAESPYMFVEGGVSDSNTNVTTVTIEKTQCTEDSIKLMSHMIINPEDTPVAFGTTFIPLWLFSDTSATPISVEYSVSEYPVVSGDSFGATLSSIPDGYQDVYFVGKSYIKLDDESVIWSKAKKVKIEENELRKVE